MASEYAVGWPAAPRPFATRIPPFRITVGMETTIPAPAAADERAREEGLRFARRMYLPRTLGLALGALCVGGALWQQGAPASAYAVLLVNALAWPHLAWPLARRSENPRRTELRNLMVDSASGGAWIAYIGFNLVPSVVLVAMLAMDKAAVGGLRFLARCLAAQLGAGLAVALLFGFELRLASSMTTTAAALPLLLAYPVTVGITAYQLARRVRRQNRLLAELSSIDDLSGLLNRRRWEEAVANEFRRCRRIGHVSTIMLIDIDHFKAINDTWGHPAGDTVIRSIARLLRETLRRHDVVARCGGEEYGAVLPGTDAAGGRILAERVRRRVEKATLEARHGVRATVSIGVAEFDPADADAAAWIGRADRALYRAKDLGRNRTVDYGPEMAEA